MYQVNLQDNKEFLSFLSSHTYTHTTYRRKSFTLEENVALEEVSGIKLLLMLFDRKDDTNICVYTPYFTK